MKSKRLIRLAYIELDTHAEIVSQFHSLMKDSQKFSVDYFFSERISSQVGIASSNIVITDPKSLEKQLKYKTYDLIIIGTAHRYFNVFSSICTIFNTAVITHNLNFSKASKFKLLKSIFLQDQIYRLKLLLKEDLLDAGQLYKKAKHLLVLSESFLTENSPTRRYLPLFFNEYNESHDKDYFIIVIPGTVSQKRRDYRHVFQRIRSWPQDPSKKTVEFVFLGKAEGAELTTLRELEKSLPQNLRLKYFVEKVPQQNFNQYMNKADVLWCPVNRYTKFFSQTEIYGETKLTGNIGDAIRYGKFAIFPTNFPREYPFIMSEDEDLANQLQSIQTERYNFENEFERQKIRQYLEEQLRHLI